MGENNGSGVSKKFVLASSLSKNCKYNPEGMSYAIPQTTLEYGLLCLKNALFLLPTTNYEETSLPATNLPTDEGAKKTIIGHQQQSSLLGSLTVSGSHKLGNNLCKQSGYTVIFQNINCSRHFYSAKTVLSGRVK